MTRTLTNETTPLVGLWVLIVPDGKHYMTGQIVTSTGDHHLVKIRPARSGVPTHSKLVTSDTLCDAETCLFPTEEELEAWLVPDDDNEPPHVVSMQKRP
jgi:hypothetical protein